MSNISTYPSYSTDFTYPVPVINNGAPCNMNPSMYPMVLQILAQLRTAQSEWNVWKSVSTSFQSAYQREQQLHFQDKLRFHFQEQQMLKQLESLRSQFVTNTDALHVEMDRLKQNLSICENSNLKAESGIQDLEYLKNGTCVLKENVLNLTKTIEKKDETLMQRAEEAKINQEKLQEALQTIKDKDIQLESIRDEKKALEEILELTKAAIRNLKPQERANDTILGQILNITEATILRQALLNDELKMQREECRNALTNSKINLIEEKCELAEELNTFKEEFNKLKAQEEENQAKFQNVVAENLKTMAASLTRQEQLNEDLVKQNDQLKKFLEDFKSKSENEKHEINEELKNLKDQIVKYKAEERENQSKMQGVLEEKLNAVDTLTKQVQLIEDLRQQKEELQASLANLKTKSEDEKRIVNEELRICKETRMPVIGPCGPAQLKQMKMPQPEEGLYKTGLQKNMVPGCIIQVIGSFKSNGDTPSINLDFPRGIALHIVFRFTMGHICRNTYTQGKWGPEETGGGMPVRRGQQFNVTITSNAESFQICINGVMFATYKHRIENRLITGIWIGGPIELQKVLYFAPTNV